MSEESWDVRIIKGSNHWRVAVRRSDRTLWLQADLVVLARARAAGKPVAALQLPRGVVSFVSAGDFVSFSDGDMAPLVRRLAEAENAIVSC